MSFETGADAYDRFMGRYSVPLAPLFADFAGATAGQNVLDVGCGPGALTDELVRRSAHVSAVDPSDSFVAAAHDRLPTVDVRRAAAEHLPHEDSLFDVSLAQLVVHFMADPTRGIREMARVTRQGGVVAACVWDHASGRGPLSIFWSAARRLDRGVEGEARLPGTSEGDLARLFDDAGLTDIADTDLEIRVEHSGFDEWWEPYTLGVGPAGTYVADLDPASRTRLRNECRAMLPDDTFVVTGRAWAARARA